ncbi:MAG: hypothetical protein ACK5LC_18595 [Coprobacillaceae bacterium]
MNLKDKVFVGIVGREVVVRDNVSNVNESYPYVGKIFSTEKDSLLMFYANEDAYYIWQHINDNKVENSFYNKEKCKKLLEKNVDIILSNKAMKL